MAPPPCRDDRRLEWSNRSTIILFNRFNRRGKQHRLLHSFREAIQPQYSASSHPVSRAASRTTNKILRYTQRVVQAPPTRRDMDKMNKWCSSKQASGRPTSLEVLHYNEKLINNKCNKCNLAYRHKTQPRLVGASQRSRRGSSIPS